MGRSLRYIEELQKFVEDNQWKRSLAIEPNQLKPDQQDPKDHPEVMNHLNLSPSKIHINRVAGTDGNTNSRPFVPGHRRAKSDGCGMFLMSSKSKHEVVQDNYKANYSHHLLDDSKLDEEPTYSRYKLVQTCSNLFKLVQTCFKLDQTFTNMFKHVKKC